MANVRIKDQTARHTSGGLAGVQIAVDHPSWASGRSMDLALLGPSVYNVKSFGALGNNTGNDATAIQNAINAAAAGGGIVFIPPGRYRCTAQLNIPPGDTSGVELVGSGMAVSILDYPTDLGSGVFAIGSTVRESAAWTRVSDLALDGPGTRVLGQSPCNMSGVQCNARWLLERIYVKNFRAGIDVSGDHGSMHHCKSTDNYYGVYWNTTSNGSDHYLERCFLDGNTLASVAVHPDGFIDGCTFIETHLGFGPYAFYREAGTPTKGFMTWSTLITCSFEAIGNGLIFSSGGVSGNDNNKVDGCSIVGGFGLSYHDGYKLGSATRRPIEVRQFTRNHIEVWGGQYGVGPAPFGGVTGAFIQTNYFNENVFLGADELVKNALPIANAPNGSNNHIWRRAGGISLLVKDGSNNWKIG